MPDAPVVLEARGIEKAFRVPNQRIDTLKERALRPFSRGPDRTLQALRGVSFDVRRGEFFGVVGRNGSGKSTLLKIMASIYRADAGTMRVAGRLAPFIELGVGFNPELTSRENVVLNGVMMGLSRREAGRRLDSVLEFAELRDFSDLKLKNYSSGMMVRLAFSVMVEADADTMLVDEVLAVGDAAFAQKCMEVFRERRRAGRTLVLVTHDMSAVQSLCDRALLLHEGETRHVGDPEEAALRYYGLNFAQAVGSPDGAAARPDVNVRVVEAFLTGEDGERIENVQQSVPFGLEAVFEARRELDAPVFGFHFSTAEGTAVFGFNETLEERVPAGRRVRIRGRLENPLLPGRFHVACLVSREDASPGEIALQAVPLLDFVVYGTRPGPGSVTVPAQVTAELA